MSKENARGMQDDAISIQVVLNEFCHSCDGWSCNPNTCCKTEWIRKLPPIQPKRGRWIKLDMHRGMADHKCTACEQECYVPTCMGEPMYAYCPNCGAKMEVNHESD